VKSHFHVTKSPFSSATGAFTWNVLNGRQSASKHLNQTTLWQLLEQGPSDQFGNRWIAVAQLL
jgi:hypothetical protein